MDQSFDEEEARQYLIKLDKAEKEEREKQRLTMLQKAIKCLKKTFSNSEVELFLVGSITRPFMFHESSDIDISQVAIPYFLYEGCTNHLSLVTQVTTPGFPHESGI